jgi:hypothetical protein
MQKCLHLYLSWVPFWAVIQQRFTHQTHTHSPSLSLSLFIPLSHQANAHTHTHSPTLYSVLHIKLTHTHTHTHTHSFSLFLLPSLLTNTHSQNAHTLYLRLSSSLCLPFSPCHLPLLRFTCNTLTLSLSPSLPFSFPLLLQTQLPPPLFL